MIQDSQIKKDVWDARVKISIGSFIINTIRFMFVFMILALFLEWQVFHTGDAFIRPVILYIGLPIAVVILIIGYFTSYVPKKRKIDLFTEHLISHKNNLIQVSIPTDLVVTKLFVSDASFGLLDNFSYLCFQDNDSLVFYPQKPDIADLDDYVNKRVNYQPVKLAKSDIAIVETGPVKTVQETTYDEKKRPVQKMANVETTIIRMKQEVDKPILATKTIDKFLGPKKPATPTTPISPEKPTSLEAKLSELKTLLDKGLISKEEYEEKRKKLIDSL